MVNERPDDEVLQHPETPPGIETTTEKLEHSETAMLQYPETRAGIETGAALRLRARSHGCSTQKTPP